MRSWVALLSVLSLAFIGLVCFVEAKATGGPIRLSDVIQDRYKSHRITRRPDWNDDGGDCDDIFCGQCVIDCNGTIGGNSVQDEFGNCCKEGDRDCTGECYGQAAIDVCGVCSGGSTGLVPGAECIERQSGCGTWCIVAITITSVTVVAGLAFITCLICSFFAAGAIRRRHTEEDRYGGNIGGRRPRSVGNIGSRKPRSGTPKRANRRKPKQRRGARKLIQRKNPHFVN